jgi:hypothetical protein
VCVCVCVCASQWQMTCASPLHTSIFGVFVNRDAGMLAGPSSVKLLEKSQKTHSNESVHVSTSCQADLQSGIKTHTFFMIPALRLLKVMCRRFLSWMNSILIFRRPRFSPSSSAQPKVSTHSPNQLHTPFSQLCAGGQRHQRTDERTKVAKLSHRATLYGTQHENTVEYREEKSRKI